MSNLVAARSLQPLLNIPKRGFPNIMGNDAVDEKSTKFQNQQIPLEPQLTTTETECATIETLKRPRDGKHHDAKPFSPVESGNSVTGVSASGQSNPPATKRTKAETSRESVPPVNMHLQRDSKDVVSNSVNQRHDDINNELGKKQSVCFPAVTHSFGSSAKSNCNKSNCNKSNCNNAASSPDVDEPTDTADKRWRVHQMAEDYVNFVGHVMYPATKMGPYGYNPEAREYPMESISLLHFIKSPIRRPSVMEKWSPYEIAVFEGSLLHYGKEFRKVSREIGSKSTNEVIDFYYIWKKTAHYQKWKDRYVNDADLIDAGYVEVRQKPRR